jgi:hypothetical protein
MESEMREFVESVIKRYKTTAMPLKESMVNKATAVPLKEPMVNKATAVPLKEPMVNKQENLVTIAAWPPEGLAALQHHFTEKPCPVSIFIEKTPLSIDLQSLPETPFNVNMDMELKANDVIPVSFKLCEPVCAKSEYRLDIDIGGTPFAGVTLRGKTMIFGCDEERSLLDKITKLR